MVDNLKQKQFKDNELFLSKLKKNNVVANWSRPIQEKIKDPLNTYVCQRCKIEFCTKLDLEIIESRYPLCEDCKK
jgi:hypothetical protein